MSSRYLIAAVIAVVLVGGAFYFFRTSLNPAQKLPSENITKSAEVKEFAVKGMLAIQATGQKAPRFDTQEIRVKQGDKVRINFENTEGFHDWVIDEFNAHTAQIQAGQTDSVEFTADKKGTFEYYCSVPNHRNNGMMGKLIVE